MIFGFNTTPAHFQACIVQALEGDHAGVPAMPHTTYMDDCTVGAPAEGGEGARGSLVECAWANTLAAMWRLALSGLPINLKKCHLLCTTLSLLRVVLFECKY